MSPNSALLASTYGLDQCTMNVCGSGALADSVSDRAALRPAGISGSLSTLNEKSTSWDVNGVPSCHLMLGRIFQMVSIVPSGFSRQVPFVVEICSAARCGTNSPFSFSTTSASCPIHSTLEEPPDFDAP